MLVLSRIIWGYLIPIALAVGGLLAYDMINGYLPVWVPGVMVVFAIVGTSANRRPVVVSRG